jgi:hypothetical protein
VGCRRGISQSEKRIGHAPLGSPMGARNRGQIDYEMLATNG